MKVKKGIFIVTYFCDQNTVLCTFWDILHLKIKLKISVQLLYFYYIALFLNVQRT